MKLIAKRSIAIIGTKTKKKVVLVI